MSLVFHEVMSSKRSGPKHFQAAVAENQNRADGGNDVTEYGGAVSDTWVGPMPAVPIIYSKRNNVMRTNKSNEIEQKADGVWNEMLKKHGWVALSQQFALTAQSSKKKGKQSSIKQV